MEAVAKDSTNNVTQPPKSGSKKGILVVAALLVVLGVGYFAYRSYYYVTTDNASVQAHSLLLSSKVAGIVLTVNAEENKKVKAGTVLVKLDDRDYQNTLDQVQAELASVQAKLGDAEKNYRRVQSLYKQGALPQQTFDTAEANFRELSRKASGLDAQVKEAQLNLAYTEIKAPADGAIARKSAEIGMLAAVGQPLVGFVASSERWITANFKETDLKSINPGKKATVTVDAVDGRTFEGVVESVSPSTGATFTLLPPDNATGNFTKVVQRVPVRIKLENLSSEDIDRLQAGLSADVSIRVR